MWKKDLTKKSLERLSNAKKKEKENPRTWYNI